MIHIILLACKFHRCSLTLLSLPVSFGLFSFCFRCALFAFAAFFPFADVFLISHHKWAVILNTGQKFCHCFYVQAVTSELRFERKTAHSLRPTWFSSNWQVRALHPLPNAYSESSPELLYSGYIKPIAQENSQTACGGSITALTNQRQLTFQIWLHVSQIFSGDFPSILTCYIYPSKIPARCLLRAGLSEVITHITWF